MDSAGSISTSSTRKLALTYARQDFKNTLGSKTEDYDDVKGMNTSFGSRVRQIEDRASLKSMDQVRQKFVLYLWRMLFGRSKSDEMAKEFGLEPVSNSPEDTGNNPNFSVIRIEGVQEMYYSEMQTMSFVSNGSVTTADGRTIDFNLELNMSQSFEQYYREEGISITNMCDPLVLNFSGNVADVTDQKFYFDLDCDGNEDEISNLVSGSGFLALDKNNDGIINDGSELFGTKSGDGFADLARYDSDGNGWIDENDSIYDSLRIWVKDASGEDKLFSLKDKNVGAIYLGNARTDFTLRGNTGNVNGAIRKTGIFLYEDGSGVGTMNHLDLAQ